MGKIFLNIDGREVKGFDGQTILEIARENGVEIPTLCHDERVQMYGSCGLCTVEIEGNPRLIRSCSTLASDNMIVKTDTERIRKNRKAALELLLSDHNGDCRAPCSLACPAQTDCQGYVGLIANGEISEAYKLIKEKIPFPSSIGRVCPHPCEDACRRKLVEEPIAIAALKRYAGDCFLTADLTGSEPVPPPPSGRSVAVIGGGPGGLSAAYYLRLKGHEVTVYDAMPHMGGMLRYGIPEYRLPKAVLQREIDRIAETGIELCNNVRIGEDITLEALRKRCDAVIVAIGAWSGTGLRCPGEELDGVIGGIDFLREVAEGNPPAIGGKVAIVGGGNTAMDACRTAVRLGASEVYNIYRRTRNEMPAEEVEIDEAEEEGVIFKNLTNPIEIIGENGRVKAVRLQVMELGEPDASGRRAPVAVEGKEELIEIDSVISAIGQKPKLDGFGMLETTKWGTIIADEKTFLTNLGKVFAIGDATNKGADIAISAIGEGGRCAEVVDKFISGGGIEKIDIPEPQFLVKSEKTADDFADREKQPRSVFSSRAAEERKRDFLEVGYGFNPRPQPRKEASRCLECGCADYFECKLIDYANKYAVEPEKFKGSTHKRELVDDHPFIVRNPEKCVLCGLCVRVCDEVVGVSALGFVDRGFDTVVKPALDVKLCDTDCVSCGLCAEVCPTGAITEKQATAKQVPLKETFTETICAYCSIGCTVKMGTKGGLLTRSKPASDGNLLCEHGKFGFNELLKNPRLAGAHIKREIFAVNPMTAGGKTFRSGFNSVSLSEAAVYANKKLQSLNARYPGSVAVAVSGSYTNEEIFLIKEYAKKALKTDNLFSFGLTGGANNSTATLDELERTDLVAVIKPDILREKHGVASMRINRAVNSGAKLVEIDNADGLEELLKSAKKAVVIYAKSALNAQEIAKVKEAVEKSGHISGARNGIIEILPEMNSRGLINLGVKAYSEIMPASVKGLFVFGGDYSAEIERDFNLEFLAVQGLTVTEAAKSADVLLPALNHAEIIGTVTGYDNVTRVLNLVLNVGADWNNLSLIAELSAVGGYEMPYRNIEDVTRAYNRSISENS